VKVLIAEDDAVLRRVLERAVQKLGHECKVARDGLEAWELHRAERADVIISDWLMPGLDGIELCQRVREDETSRYTYFIFTTALGDKQHFLTAMQAGADDYITKPVDLDEVQVRLFAAARLTALHRRLLEQNAELERLGHASHEAARTDPLTRVGNRLRLREDLETLSGHAARYKRPYCVALCDVDWFKRYNDHYGHLAGDDALCAVAGAMRARLRGSDSIYRYGGEEFLIILPEQTQSGAVVAMNRVRQAVEALDIPHEGKSPPGRLTISAGIAVLRSNSSDEWLKQADEALYRAKQLGRNRVEVFEIADPA
jgi:diguanylate cyclase (GGDEF)-like protein